MTGGPTSPAIGVGRYRARMCHGREAPDEVRTILVVPEERTPSDPPHIDMVEGAGCIQAAPAEHVRRVPMRGDRVKSISAISALLLLVVEPVRQGVRFRGSPATLRRKEGGGLVERSAILAISVLRSPTAMHSTRLTPWNS